MVWEVGVDAAEPNDQPDADQQVADRGCFVQKSRVADRLDIPDDFDRVRMVAVDPGTAEALVWVDSQE